MCEILVTRGNKAGHCFGSEAYKYARAGNPDGAGYVILEKDGARWEVVGMETYAEKPSAYSGRTYSYGGHTFESPAYWQDEEYYKEMYPEAYGIDKKKKGKKQEQIGFNFRTGGYTPEVDSCIGDMYDKNSELKPNQIMIAHFRLATSGGVVTHNTHPIVVGNYMVIHNGIFGYEKLPAGDSDTKHFAYLLNEAYKKKTLSHYRQEQKIIERLLGEAGGYHSIFVYSWKTGRLYYYKSETASFQYDQSGLLGATNADRFPIMITEAKTAQVLV